MFWRILTGSDALFDGPNVLYPERLRPLVFEQCFRTTILELEFQRVEADTLDGLENLVGLPLLQEHNLVGVRQMVEPFTLASNLTNFSRPLNPF